MGQLTYTGLTVLASFLTSGSIAIFVFAYNLQAVPLSIIGASYSVAAFPSLATALARGERDVFLAHVATAARPSLKKSKAATRIQECHSFFSGNPTVSTTYAAGPAPNDPLVMIF